MAKSTGFKGKAYLKYGTSSASTTLGQITRLTRGELTTDTIDITNFDSEGGLKEFIAGDSDWGNVTCDIVYTPAAYDALKAVKGQNLVFEIGVYDGAGGTVSSTDTFEGLLVQLSQEISLGDKMTCTVGFKVSGDIS